MFHRYKKRIILTLLTLCVSTSVTRGQNALESAQFLHDTASFFSLILDVIYVILWPLLIVAGWALDNSLVLGEVFHLDQALRQFWVIVRNLANFALGFIVIWMIAKHLWGKGSEKEIISTIGKALIAGIGIQASRFLMVALLDISTIAIYSIGAMPLEVLPDSSASNAHRIIKPIITMNNNMSDSDATSKQQEFFNVNYSCGDGSQFGSYTHTDTNGDPLPTKNKSIQSCLIHNNYIIARRPDLSTNISDNAWTDGPINFNYCVRNQNIYKVNDTSSSDTTPGADVTRYYIPLLTDIDENQTPSTFTGSNSYAAMFTGTFSEDQGWSFYEYDNAINHSPNVSNTEALSCPSIKDIQDKAQGMAGVLTTLFASIMEFKSLTLFTNGDNLGRLSVTFFIKMLMAIALVAPLIVLAISLIKRVGYLWIALIGSPIIILLKAFGKDIGNIGEKITLDEIKVFDLTEVIGLIFMPVVTIFALSIGIVFLTTLQQGFDDINNHDSSPIFEEMGIHANVAESNGTISCYTVFVTDICYEAGGFGHGWDNFLTLFSGTIVQLFGIGILWMIVFASFKASSISRGLGEGVDSLAKNIALSTPIIPLPGKDADGNPRKIGLGALGVGDRRSAVFSQLNAHYDNKVRKQTQGLFPGDDNMGGSSKSSSTSQAPIIDTSYAQHIATAVGSGGVASIQQKLNQSTDKANTNPPINKDTIDHITQVITDSDKGYAVLEHETGDNTTSIKLSLDDNEHFVAEELKTDNKQDNEKKKEKEPEESDNKDNAT